MAKISANVEIKGTNETLGGLVAKSIDRYSTDEVKTNKVWIDGKPIYRKVVISNMGSSLNTWHKIADVPFDKIVSLLAYTYEPNGNTYVFPRNYTSFGNEEAIAIYASKNNSGIYEQHNYTFMNDKQVFIIVEYTKN